VKDNGLISTLIDYTNVHAHIQKLLRSRLVVFQCLRIPVFITSKVDIKTWCSSSCLHLNPIANINSRVCRGGIDTTKMTYGFGPLQVRIVR